MSGLTQTVLDLSSVVPGDGEVRVALYGLAVVLYGAREVDAQVLDVTSAVVGLGYGGSVLAGVFVVIYEVAKQFARLL